MRLMTQGHKYLDFMNKMTIYVYVLVQYICGVASHFLSTIFSKFFDLSVSNPHHDLQILD